jgi:TRC40/GET3/ArsA family transport-energizing ATPase
MKFSNIIIDTAPTGHTLRLLAAPELLDRSLGKVLALRKMLDGASSLMKSIFSFGQQTDANGGGEADKEETLVEKIEKAQHRLRAFAKLLHNDKSSEFIAVSIPTQMAVSETIDLVSTLKKEGIPVKRCVVNQVLPSDSKDGGVTLIESRQKDQARALKMLEDDTELAKLEQLRSPLLDLEVKGVPALQYFGRSLWQDCSILDENFEQKFVIVGGKGGVGKTTSSASLALSLAQEGHTVLIVSTDPAHSLGDSVSQDVSGGQPVMLEGTDLNVWAMEINPEETMQQLRGLLKKVEDSEIKEDGTGNPAVDFGKILQKVQDLKLDELLEEPPPGTDEAIAVAKVVQFAEKPEFAKFTRIIVDTAPTGHTLRLLTLPSFISLSIDKILKFKSVLTQLVGQSKGDVAIEKLEELQRQMDDAQVLFRDKERTEFVIVGIPTYLSVAESSRLVRALQEEDVLVRHIVTNQILNFEATPGDIEAEERIKKFVTSKLRDQQSALDRLQSDPSCKDLELLQGPIVNMEVRGVPALQYFASIIWS